MNSFSFGKRSLEVLKTCCEPLAKIAHIAIVRVNFSVREGYRSLDNQQYLFNIGKSKKKEGKHNVYPSEAFDIAPFPIDWKDRERFVYLAGIIIGVGEALGIKVRWGGDWDLDSDLWDQEFMDLGHFEII